MLTAEMVRGRHVGPGQAARVAALWNEVYPAARDQLTAVIRAQRGSARPTADVPALEQVRLELGQLDRGTYRACGRTAFSPVVAYGLLRDLVAVTAIGSPHAGQLHRLAAKLADLVAARDVLAQTGHALQTRTAR